MVFKLYPKGPVVHNVLWLPRKKLTFANVSNKVKQPLGKDLVNNELLVKKLRNVFTFVLYMYMFVHIMYHSSVHIYIFGML